MFVIGGGRLEKQIVALVERIQAGTDSKLDKIRNFLDLSDQVNTLREEKNQLIIDKSQIKEQYDRREREIEHKLGLERQRQEQELVLKEREVTVKVREENLTADKKRFEDQMKFMTDRMVTENNQLQGMIKPLLEALPKMTIEESVGRRR